MLIRTCLATSLLIAGLSRPSPAADPPAKGKGEVVKVTAEKEVLGTGIDFGSELGLDFASLKGLGARIEQARAIGDPVGLAAAAAELAAAENVSGKTTALTAAALTKEAVALAEQRSHSAELKAVALLVADEATKKNLAERAAKAAEREDLIKKGERPRGIAGDLIVLNNSGRTVAVYVNGRYVGNVSVNNEQTFSVGDNAEDETTILARSGKYRFGPRVVRRGYNNFTWTLNPLDE